jgi:hypothetical protein
MREPVRQTGVDFMTVGREERTRSILFARGGESNRGRQQYSLTHFFLPALRRGDCVACRHGVGTIRTRSSIMTQFVLIRRLGAILLRAFDAVFVRSQPNSGWSDKLFLF